MKFLLKVSMVLAVATLLTFACQKSAEVNTAMADTELKAGGDVFLQASGSTTQLVPGTVQAIIDQDDGSNFITLSGNAATVDKNGTYFIVAAPQVLLTTPGVQFTCWLQVNGVDVSNSNVLLEAASVPYRDVIISQGLVSLNKGDVVTVMVSSNGPGTAIEAISPTGQPLVPSIIFSMYKI